MTDPRATILLDLDDTLLRNDMGAFLPAYFQAIQGWLARTLPSGDFMGAFLEASQVMLANDRPDRTLADAFYSHFLARIDRRFEDLAPAIDSFYREAYPGLRAQTGQADGAPAVVEALRQAGHALVVATNPLFPAAAIHQRVDWAGLTMESTDFDLVTTFERFHFAKPDAAYYAEILATLAWPEGPVVMVGNEAINDIQGATDLGLATYHVLWDEPRTAEPGSERHGAGSLADFPAWLDARAAGSILPDYGSLDAAAAILKSTAAVLQTLVREADPAGWHRRTGAEWTAAETLSHLRDVESQVNRPRAEMFLTTENPFITGVDTDRWHAGGFGALPPVGELLDGFMQSRIETLEILAEIPRAAWHMPARHSIFGPTDLLEIAGIMAGHDQGHIRQIHAALAAPGSARGDQLP